MPIFDHLVTTQPDSNIRWLDTPINRTRTEYDITLFFQDLCNHRLCACSNAGERIVSLRPSIRAVNSADKYPWQGLSICKNSCIITRFIIFSSAPGGTQEQTRIGANHSIVELSPSLRCQFTSSAFKWPPNCRFYMSSSVRYPSDRYDISAAASCDVTNLSNAVTPPV